MLEQINKKGSLLSYRKDIKVLDCTIRDGGLMTNCKFDEQFVKNVYNANIKAGVDYMEFGYKASKSMFGEDEFGPWKFCTEEDLRKIVGNNDSDMKVSIMADVGRTDFENDVPQDRKVS